MNIVVPISSIPTIFPSTSKESKDLAIGKKIRYDYISEVIINLVKVPISAFYIKFLVV